MTPFRSMLLCLWLGLLVTATTGHDVSSTSTPLSTATENSERPERAAEKSSGRQQYFQPAQAPYYMMGYGLQYELMMMKSKMLILETKLEATETELEVTRLHVQSQVAGSTFIRWGRKTCTDNSLLVYAGVAGGSWYNHYGAAANPLCLTLSPQFGNATVSSACGLLYGAEYKNIPRHQNHDVPCSVCRADLSTTIMMPATHACPSGWTNQYTGYLASGYYGYRAASQYVCLDGDPEDASSGQNTQHGYFFYYTSTRCGSLPCPPYINGKVVLCAVCSK